MELLVGCALGVVAFSSYVTLRDVLNDLKRERQLQSPAAWLKGGASKLANLSEITFPSLPGSAPVPVRVRRPEMESRLYRAHLYHD